MNDTLNPTELHRLWLSLEEKRRLAFLESLSEEACQRLLLYQICLKALEPSETDKKAHHSSPKGAPRVQ